MDILNNKEFILKEIDRKTDQEINKIKEEFSDQLKSFKKEQEEKFEAKLNRLKAEHNSELERLEKQLRSSFDLNNRKMIMEKQGEMYERVLTKLKSLGKTELTRIFKGMLKSLERDVGKLKDIKTPKGIKIGSAKDVLKELKITGVKDKELYEITFEDYLDKNINDIYKIINKELF